MATFRVLPGKCVMVDGAPPFAYRHVSEGQVFDGDPARFKHLITGGIAAIVDQETIPAEVVAAPFVEVSADVAPVHSPKMKAGRRE
jgi:hypothetical protein